MTLITPHLALGNCQDPVKHSQHIDALLCCACELPLPPGKPSHHLPLYDGEPIEPEFLELAFRFIDEQLQAKHLVLVYCGHGLSRSVSVLTGYLASKSFESPDEILAKIRKLRPAANPSSPTFQSVIRHVSRKRSLGISGHS